MDTFWQFYIQGAAIALGSGTVVVLWGWSLPARQAFWKWLQED